MKGPQKTLYVPKQFLTEGTNCVMVFELDGVVQKDGVSGNDGFVVEFVDKPILV